MSNYIYIYKSSKQGHWYVRCCRVIKIISTKFFSINCIKYKILKIYSDEEWVCLKQIWVTASDCGEVNEVQESDCTSPVGPILEERCGWQEWKAHARASGSLARATGPAYSTRSFTYTQTHTHTHTYVRRSSANSREWTSSSEPVFSQPCSHSRRIVRPLTLSPRPPRVHVYARAHTCLWGILARQAIFSFNDLMDSFHSYKAPESMESERERIDPEEIPAAQETRSRDAKASELTKKYLTLFQDTLGLVSTRGCSVWELFL